MKTAVAFLKEHRDDATIDAIEARDDEWRRFVEEAQAERDRLANQVESERALRAIVEEERDRLMGELAEARRLLRAMKATFSASTPWTNEEKAVDDYLAALWGVAATPAEQAQGEVAKPVPAGAAVAALAKRVDGLEHEAQEDAKAWADTALTLMNRVTKLEAVIKRIDAEHAEMCPQHAGLAAPPPPEAAGPWHAFVSMHGDHKHNDKCTCAMGCRYPFSRHAVPPIPGGGAR